MDMLTISCHKSTGNHEIILAFQRTMRPLTGEMIGHAIQIKIWFFELHLWPLLSGWRTCWISAWCAIVQAIQIRIEMSSRRTGWICNPLRQAHAKGSRVEKHMQSLHWYRTVKSHHLRLFCLLPDGLQDIFASHPRVRECYNAMLSRSTRLKPDPFTPTLRCSLLTNTEHIINHVSPYLLHDGSLLFNRHLHPSQVESNFVGHGMKVNVHRMPVTQVGHW